MNQTTKEGEFTSPKAGGLVSSHERDKKGGPHPSKKHTNRAGKQAVTSNFGAISREKYLKEHVLNKTAVPPVAAY